MSGTCLNWSLPDPLCIFIINFVIIKFNQIKEVEAESAGLLSLPEFGHFNLHKL